SLEFRNVGYTLNKDGLEILKGISGAAPAGVVLAVMGPSGAGKSTLVDILAGKRKDGKVTGQILLNGKQVHESDIRRAVGFVDQEDTLPSTQTVYEAVLFSAMLRLPEAMPVHRVHERVAEVIEMLGLTHCSNRRIGNVTSRGISGGEKRRVSIALELITRPPILILDEPTSGLDSYSAHMVVDQLCKLAASRTTTVILTIHQPRSDIFHMFNQALVISNGEALYFGPTDTAADYFRRRDLVCPPNYNIADYLLDIAMNQDLVAKAKNYEGDDDEKTGISSGHQTHVSGNAVSRRANAVNGNVINQASSSDTTRTSVTTPEPSPYETAVRIENERSSGSSTETLSTDSATTNKRQKTVYPTSFLTQLRVIMKRNLQTLIRDKSLLVLHLAVSIVLGIFIGGLYFHVSMNLAGFQNRAGSLFFMLALLGFSSISALGAFTDTRTLFIKERSNGYYPPAPFIISTLLFDLIPLRIIPSLFMGCISYFMIGLSPVVATFFKFLLILVLFNIATAMFCLVIAAGVRTTGVASLASSIVMLFMMLFGGFMINSGNIPAALTWIQYLSMFKYGFEALAVNEVATSQLVDTIQGVAFNVPGSLILQKLFGFDLGGYWRNMIILIVFIVVFIATFWMLSAPLMTDEDLVEHYRARVVADRGVVVLESSSKKLADADEELRILLQKSRASASDEPEPPLESDRAEAHAFTLSLIIKSQTLVPSLSLRLPAIEALLSEPLSALCPGLEGDPHVEATLVGLQVKVFELLGQSTKETAGKTREQRVVHAVLMTMNHICSLLATEQFEPPTSEHGFVSAWTHTLNVLFHGSKVRAILEQLVSTAARSSRLIVEEEFGATKRHICGRKVDMSIRVYADHTWENEVCVFELKSTNASKAICEQQQRKSVRLNGAILLELEHRGVNIANSYPTIAERRGLVMDFYTLRRHDDILGAGRSTLSDVWIPSHERQLKQFLKSNSLHVLLAFAKLEPYILFTPSNSNKRSKVPEIFEDDDEIEPI
ncbi:hypothetical protein BGZ58_000088, partial [Dissophora ornata]